MEWCGKKEGNGFTNAPTKVVKKKMNARRGKRQKVKGAHVYAQQRNPNYELEQRGQNLVVR